ncbi:MAG: hypothetical protein ABR970_11305 [Roseiarcus sp.]
MTTDFEASGDGAATLTESLRERIRHDIIPGALPPASRLELEKLTRTCGVSVTGGAPDRKPRAAALQK